MCDCVICGACFLFGGAAPQIGVLMGNTGRPSETGGVRKWAKMLVVIDYHV